MHRGSLFAALASFLDARARGGTWLVRMEDLDSARTLDGMDTEILSVLDTLGMRSDEPVIWQSDRIEFYAAALETLRRKDQAYRCTCSRSETGGACSGRCREYGAPDGPAAWRLRLQPDDIVTFEDRVLGTVSSSCRDLGDPVIYRRDGVPAYQLAVVIDDDAQGITDVVRGADLVDSTAWQIRLAQALGLPIPRYAHVPLVIEPDGSKLSKSRQALPVTDLDAGAALLESLRLLRQGPPAQLAGAAPAAILDWAIGHWNINRLSGLRSVALPM